MTTTSATAMLRRFLVSSSLVSHDKETKRGILKVFEQDQFLAKNPKRGDFLPNDNRSDPMMLRHMRDAAEYWAACVYQ
jgi:hypothetical protein